MMRDDTENTNGGASRRKWSVSLAVAALVALFATEYYYKAHPQFLEQHLGSFGLSLLFIAGGCYLVFTAVMGVRNSAIEGNYVSVKFKRADRPFMFWSVVIFDIAGGTFFLVGGIGHFFGLW